MVATGASTSADLDASLRVAIKIGNQVYIYAPVTGATTSYTVAGTTAVTATASTGNGIVNTNTTVTTIPDNTATIANAVEAEIYQIGRAHV